MDAIRIIRLALAVLSDRLLILVALGMTFGLAAWAMQDPTWMRIAMAAFFALCVFLPTLFRERTRDERGHQTDAPSDAQ